MHWGSLFDSKNCESAPTEAILVVLNLPLGNFFAASGNLPDAKILNYLEARGPGPVGSQPLRPGLRAGSEGRPFVTGAEYSRQSPEGGGLVNLGT
ncbi:MAG: hypothetical protein CMP28_12830 [Roseibacillus sp.]|nr:hypothetical protein [Roseibacillus sp.]